MAGEDSRNLPVGWVLSTEKKDDGTQVQYYMNLGTGIRVYTYEDMFQYVNSESGENNPQQNPMRARKVLRHQFCSRCKKVGHNIFNCPLMAQATIAKPVEKRRGPSRSGICGKTGHNRCNCKPGESSISLESNSPESKATESSKSPQSM